MSCNSNVNATRYWATGDEKKMTEDREYSEQQQQPPEAELESTAVILSTINNQNKKNVALALAEGDRKIPLLNVPFPPKEAEGLGGGNWKSMGVLPGAGGVGGRGWKWAYFRGPFPWAFAGCRGSFRAALDPGGWFIFRPCGPHEMCC